MKVSVVVALFNKAGYVRAAVCSALEQTYPVHEVIVVDDGSTDGSAALLEGLGDTRLRIVRQPNGGVSAARNRGIVQATGDWIAFLDADDWYHPDLIRGLAQAHKAWPQAGMLGAGFCSLAPDDQPRAEQWPSAPHRFDIEHVPDLRLRWMQGTPFATSSVAIRADLLRGMQPCFAINESNGEDLDVWFRVAEQTSVALVDSPLAGYRAMTDGLSAQSSLITEPPYLERMRQRALHGGLPAAQRGSALWFVGQQQVTLARAAVSCGRRAEALALLMRARHVFGSLRWHVSLLMALLFPAGVVAAWQRSRLRGGARREQRMQKRASGHTLV